MFHKFYQLLMVVQPKDYMFSATVLNLGTTLSVLKGKLSALICMVKLLKMEEGFPPLGFLRLHLSCKAYHCHKLH